MWPFSSSSSKLPAEQQDVLRRRVRAERQAYKSCVKANGGDASHCMQLEIRLIERWSELVCKKEAEDFQACYTASITRGDEKLADCSQEIKKMRSCLQRLGVEPLQ